MVHFFPRRFPGAPCRDVLKARFNLFPSCRIRLHCFTIDGVEVRHVALLGIVHLDVSPNVALVDALRLVVPVQGK